MPTPVNRGNNYARGNLNLGITPQMHGGASSYQNPRIRPILITITLNGVNGLTPVQGPAFDVPEGSTVEISPKATNAATCFFSTVGPQAALTGPSEEVQKTANFPREINIRNLSQLWMNGGAGDGIKVTVRRPAQ